MNTNYSAVLEKVEIKKIRTIREIITELKKIDANSSLTENALRTLIREKRIHSVQIGKKHLLTLEDVMEFFD